MDLTADKIDKIGQEKFIFGSLFLVANKLQVAADKWDTEVSSKQWLLIVMITQFDEENPTLSKVAELMGSSRQNVKQLALKLEARGFITIEKDKKDARAIRLRVTPECKAFFKKREEAELLFLKEFYKGISKDEMKVLYKAMYKLNTNIENIQKSLKGEW